MQPAEQRAWQHRPDVVAAQRRTLRLLAGAQVLGGIGFGAGLSVGILLAAQVTRSEGWAGVARTSSTVVAALVAVPLAVLAARSGRRISLGLAWAMATTGSVALVAAAQLADSNRLFASALLIYGLGISGAGSAASLQSRYAATDLAPPEHRSRQLSLVVWATTIGTVLGPNLGAPGEALAESLGLTAMAGPFVIAAAMLTLATVTILLLRPDPLLLAATHTHVDPHGRTSGTRAAMARAWRIGGARFALVSMCAAHTVMVGVMTMTPVHMDHHGASITVVGLTISIHVLGMFAFSPLVGIAADRLGRSPVIVAGGGTLLLATLVAGTAGSSMGQVTAGLFLLGVGWSLVLVPASTLLTESVPAADRTRVQGGSDAAMNVSAAIGAAGSGPLLGLIGFGGLNALSAAIVLAAVPLVLGAHRLPRGDPRPL
ncbi:MFS transporter [Nakamurella sp.]|uniref:MFS transporter n=1 Tax=Nakamurella sp. TaxID=1869182 RepID=UPI0037838476